MRYIFTVLRASGNFRDFNNLLCEAGADRRMQKKRELKKEQIQREQYVATARKNEIVGPATREI